MELTGLHDATYFCKANTPSILFFTRENKEKKIKVVKDFKPYMFILKSDYLKFQKLLTSYVYSVEEDTRKIVTGENEKVIKLILNTPFDIYNVKKIIPKTFEADILFVNKYIIDNVKKLNNTEYRINYFDIETTSYKGFPDYHNPEEQIISIASFDTYEQKYKLWIWHDTFSTEKLTKNFNNDDITIYRFKNEQSMLDSFLDFINQTQPDYLIAWNISFDINYLYARCEKLKLNVHKLSPLYNTVYRKEKISPTKWQEKGLLGKRVASHLSKKNVKIVGLQCFDLLTAYRCIVAQEQHSWALDYIAKKELGQSKLDTNFNIGKTWETNPGYIEEYNYMDVKLIKLLDDKLKLTNYYNIIKDSVFLYNINDTFSSGKVLDNYVLKKFKDTFIFPSKVFSPELRKSVGGAFVRQPIPGVYSNIAVFDFSGFYPNLIKTFNLSGDVIRNEKIYLQDTEADEIQDVKDLTGQCYDYDDVNQLITYKIRTEKFKADLQYSLKYTGVMGQSVTDLVKMRKQAQKVAKQYKYGTLEYEQWDKIQQSYKFIINAAYGTSAYPGFRLFSNANANAITSFARMMSKWVSHRLDEMGWKTVGGDTDSLFIQLKTDVIDDNLKEIQQIQKQIEQIITEFVSKFLPPEYIQRHTLEMDMEKIYKKLLLLDVKKRYIGILKYFKGEKTEKVHYMGLDLKKSNTIPLSKEAQMDLSLALLKEQDVRNVFLKYYEKVKKSNDYKIFQLSSKLNKPITEYKSRTPAVRASNWSNKNLGTHFHAGTKFYILYLEKNCNLDTDCIAFEDIEQLKQLNLKIDKKKYVKDLHNKFDNISRGLPKVKKLNDFYYEYALNKNKNLQEWVK